MDVFCAQAAAAVRVPRERRADEFPAATSAEVLPAGQIRQGRRRRPASAEQQAVTGGPAAGG